VYESVGPVTDSGTSNKGSIIIPEPSSDKYALKQNYPNPFNPSTTIVYILQESDKISLKIYNLVGQEIETLINGYQIAGEHKIEWNPEGLPNGIFICRLQASEFFKTKKLILLK